MASLIREQAIIAVEAQLKSKPVPDDSDEVRKMVEEWKSNPVKIAVSGASGELYASMGSGIFDHMPDGIERVELTTEIQDGFPENHLTVRLDFRSTPAMTNYNPWDLATPNDSLFICTGPDSTWTNGAFTAIREFFDRRRLPWQFLHTVFFYNLAGWLIAMPAAMWVAYRIDSRWLSRYTDVNPALRISVVVYCTLLGFLMFRLLLHWIRWSFPRVEYEGRPSKWQKTLSVAVLSAVLVDPIWSLLSGLYKLIISM